MDIVSLIALALALAFLAESMVEYLFGQAVDHIPSLHAWRWSLIYVAMLAGVGLSYYYRLDLINVIVQAEPTPLGMLLSGLIIGRGANFVHEFVSTYLKRER
jgi:hypothetical protein